MKKLSKFLFIIARSPIGALIIGWSFAYLSDFIPVNKLYETDLLVAFHHPKPGHQTHILIFLSAFICVRLRPISY